MWGTFLKLGGSLLAGLGIDWAWDSYQESQATAVEQAQMNKQANWGKWILISAAVLAGYSMLKKGR
ncbi:MAG: hypothetical protein J6J35_01475 [Alphaproteobacteria bacterium]|nr:hypothetical protein [Alphaproteobacteria bacterium]